MRSIKEEITAIFEQYKKRLSEAKNQADLLGVKNDFLSRNGSITQLSKILKTIPDDQRKIIGPLVANVKNEAKSLFEHAIQLLERKVTSSAATLQETFDVSAYIPNQFQGNLHLYTKILEQLTKIFSSMGFTHTDGPEVETPFNNFEALNIPADHPALDLHDTFWLSVPNHLMRTHTSNVQAHAMRQGNPPFAIFAPGRVYRNEAIDATHEFAFTQGEVLLVDKKVSIANLLATSRSFLRLFFEDTSLQIRVRPGYFPFVEPGLEIDASCSFCQQGCSICKGTQWIELLGSGLVHPKVLKIAGIDPEIYSGFAFGFGIERLAMIKYGITDIRLFHSNKTHFLTQF